MKFARVEEDLISLDGLAGISKYGSDVSANGCGITFTYAGGAIIKVSFDSEKSRNAGFLDIEKKLVIMM